MDFIEKHIPIRDLWCRISHPVISLCIEKTASYFVLIFLICYFAKCFSSCQTISIRILTYLCIYSKIIFILFRLKSGHHYCTHTAGPICFRKRNLFCRFCFSLMIQNQRSFFISGNLHSKIYSPGNFCGTRQHRIAFVYQKPALIVHNPSLLLIHAFYDQSCSVSSSTGQWSDPMISVWITASFKYSLRAGDTRK